jgi:hypothetical protein
MQNREDGGVKGTAKDTLSGLVPFEKNINTLIINSPICAFSAAGESMPQCQQKRQKNRLLTTILLVH